MRVQALRVEPYGDQAEDVLQIDGTKTVRKFFYNFNELLDFHKHIDHFLA